MIGERITDEVAKELLGNLYNPAYEYSLVFELSGVYITATDENGDVVDSDIDLCDDFIVKPDALNYNEDTNLDDIWGVADTPLHPSEPIDKVSYYPIVVAVLAVVCTAISLIVLFKGGM